MYEDDLDAKGEVAQRGSHNQPKKKLVIERRIDWVKQMDNTPYLLNLLPLNSPRQMKCDGVYVIWYLNESGIPKTVRTGIKSPNDHLMIMRNFSTVQKYADHTLHITWAESKSKDLVSIWVYLYEKLQPLEGPYYFRHYLPKKSLPIPVNLPWGHYEVGWDDPSWLIPDVIPKKFNYDADWWRELSRWYREQKGWRCEECNILLDKHTRYLHTHHTQGTQYNEPKYLMSLCIGCHAKRHPSLKKKEKETYQNFIRDYGDQWKP